MSKVQIQNFNYFTSGTKSKMFSLDLCHDDGTIEKNATFFGSVEKQNNMMNSIDPYNKYSSLLIGTSGVVVHPIYDIKDVCIKQIDKSGSSYIGDVFCHDICCNPIEFSQIQDITYVLNNLQSNSIVTYSTNLKDTRNQNFATIDSTNYIFKINKHDKNTFIYGDNDKNELTDSFEIGYNLENILYNTIVEIPQSNTYNDYDSGDINGNTIIAKNVYNSTYSMQMSAISSNAISSLQLLNSRQYCGIGCCGNNIYLKYFDNIDYNQNQNSNLSNLDMEYSKQSGYPYQKIESFGYINRFRNKSTHKSNLFSVKIQNLDFSAIDNQNQLVDKLKLNIKNVVKQIVKDTCPVNTQLFDVYFN